MAEKILFDGRRPFGGNLSKNRARYVNGRHVCGSWLAQGSGRRVTLPPGASFVYINGTLELTNVCFGFSLHCQLI